MGEISRARLLRGFLSGKSGRVDQHEAPSAPAALRPPWAISDAFASICDGCGACLPVCETGIIGKDADAKPSVSFSESGCTLCGACADACPTGALKREDSARAWPHVAIIGADCLSFRGTDCRMCGDHCTERAIAFTPLGRGRWLALVDDSRCSGCGACLAPCPAGAITLHPLSVSPSPNPKEPACA